MVLNDVLLRLINLYLLLEQQYIHASVNSTSSILKKFFEQRAFERMEFVEELEFILQTHENSDYPFKKLDELYRWHKNHYGKNALRTALISNLYSLMIDDKEMDLIAIEKQALEICDYLSEINLSCKMRSVLQEQVLRMESGIVSMSYLKEIQGISKN